ncbi:stage II sporulation protein D [Lederbergia sp. NSJ-179]|uniref:stage II sporulation protein D n=1 Tax=Lederbergia sp. NSJ-179 TaxID=2931402 RepID=UPI001FD17618|nr:stage II sporulation protein D [Lederbergia sp. NSJ-179]MCJ7840583.1 stage II sporulation protein D [Lederbergia sp. NSJ-179]
MKSIKPIFISATILITLTFLLPSLVVSFSAKEKTAHQNEAVESTPPEKAADSPEPDVAVFRSATEKIETFPLEDYVTGVVAVEMPADFEVEALKAQALAARTYVVNFLLHTEDNTVPEGANITDTVTHQVFKNRDELKKLWGKDFAWKYKKVSEAVQATKGEILTYQDKPITASFFSTSNGYTENSEEYWKDKIPYLKSVESPWDSKAPNFESKKKLSVKEFEQLLGVNIGDSKEVGTIKSKTSGHKVATVQIGDKTFEGREVREKLNLRSTDFQWSRSGDSITIITKGYGHGVGMSQYGANGMAKEGKNYRDIVQHYYHDIHISEANQLFDKKYAAQF